MTQKEENSKHYDLEERTFTFAQRVRVFVRALKRTICNIEDGRQLVKSSGSVGANYIEANEALSKKDFRMGSGFRARRRRKASTG
jgi:four helix bundle protein